MNAPAVAGNAMNMQNSPGFTLTDCLAKAKQSLTGDGRRKSRGGWGARNAPEGQACVSTVTVADRHAGKVVGKPYWGKPAVRFDEGTKGTVATVELGTRRPYRKGACRKPSA